MASLPPTPAARMDFRILGPLEALDDGHAVEAGWPQAARATGLAPVAPERDAQHRAADRRALGGASAGNRCQDAAGLHLPPAEGARGRGGRRFGRRATDPRARLRPGARSRPPRRAPLRATRQQRAGASSPQATPQRASSTLERALSLWRGPPLADLAYRAVRAARDRTARRPATWRRSSSGSRPKLALGAHAEVVGELEALIGEHPFRERLRAQLMLALYRCDRQADALQAYQDARGRWSRSWASSRASIYASSSEQCSRKTRNSNLAVTKTPATAGRALEASVSAFVGRERELGRAGRRARRRLCRPRTPVPARRRARHRQEPPRRRADRARPSDAGRACWSGAAGRQAGRPRTGPGCSPCGRTFATRTPRALRSQLGERRAATSPGCFPSSASSWPICRRTPRCESEGARFRLFDAA